MLFHFPFPLPSADRDQCYWKYFTESSKEDELLQLCLALYWSAASLALFHENALLPMQADT